MNQTPTKRRRTKDFLIIKPLGEPLCLCAFVAIFMAAYWKIPEILVKWKLLLKYLRLYPIR